MTEEWEIQKELAVIDDELRALFGNILDGIPGALRQRAFYEDGNVYVLSGLRKPLLPDASTIRAKRIAEAKRLAETNFGDFAIGKDGTNYCFQWHLSVSSKRHDIFESLIFYSRVVGEFDRINWSRGDRGDWL
jgi:hypothetical protein